MASTAGMNWVRWVSELSISTVEISKRLLELFRGRRFLLSFAPDLEAVIDDTAEERGAQCAKPPPPFHVSWSMIDYTARVNGPSPLPFLFTSL